MNKFPITPDGFLNPYIAALVAQMIALWLRQYLNDWRWRDILLLLLCITVQLCAAAASSHLNTSEELFSVIWLGFIGASVATFGYETIVNLLGILNGGPRATMKLRAKLGLHWREERW